MADDGYRLRLATALATRNPVGILVDTVMAVRDDRLHAAEATIARVEQLRDKWLAWPDNDMHYAAGLMLAAHLDGQEPDRG